MSICYICNKNNDTCYSNVCHNCQQTAMLSTTDAKKTYKLTDEEIKNAKLFSVEIDYRYAHGYKYIISELENLLIKLTENSQDSDKRKHIALKIIEKRNLIKKRYEFIQSEVILLLSKYDKKYIDNLLNKINKLSENHSKVINIDELDCISQICEIIEKKIIENIEKEKRIENIEKLLKKGDKKIYVTLNSYNNYINNGSDNISSVYKNIGEDIKKMKIKHKKIKEIDDILNVNVSEEFISKAKTFPIYTNYINKNEGELESVISDIIKKYNISRLTDKRKDDLDKLITDKCDKNMVKNFSQMMSYKRFITDGNIENINKIFKNLEKKYEKNLLEEKLDKELKKNGLWKYLRHQICLEYLCGKKELNDVLNDLAELKKNKNKNKN